ncbi:methylglyoxal reductase (NADPH-dependent) gre2 [Ceratobasidium sp. 414]|nr:methylglyoxal reductase (NADPH-dependent) gre2 [Ceratobasidium sp. 414]
MPSIKAPATVLVTDSITILGASGFIAAWICQTLLDAGYTFDLHNSTNNPLRGTVRSASKGDYLVYLFNSYGEKFQYAIVKDMSEGGAFDEAVKGVDAVVHTASPCTFEADDPQELIAPAVNGTMGVLKSIEKFASQVQRVIFTSSAATIVDPTKPTGTVFTENDWNTYSVKHVEEKGKEAGNDMYRASKVLAEKAAWAECERQGKWDLATIHPLVTLGPMLHEVSDPSNLNTSVGFLYKVINTKEGEISQDRLLAPNTNFGDVRDVALAHLRALELPEASGERFITCLGPYTWQDVLDVLPPSYPRGTRGAGKSVTHTRFDSAKATRVLGIEFRSFEDTIKDTERDLRQRGWLSNN